MKYQKTFTLEEAKQLLPKVRQMIVDANEEVKTIVVKLKKANQEFQKAEDELGAIKTTSVAELELTRLRECRAKFEKKSVKLSAVQHEYEDCLYKWIEKITDLGIILRDLPTGLIDFPAEKGIRFICCVIASTTMILSIGTCPTMVL